ncbi:hypothetical protein Z949_1366 [Sulfitobacter guttiformis KCTC 32187]|nr:hypothetical protein Z949_1366 [Sulfitobacter guttiformis KCTC 32187]
MANRLLSLTEATYGPVPMGRDLCTLPACFNGCPHLCGCFP